MTATHSRPPLFIYTIENAMFEKQKNSILRLVAKTTAAVRYCISGVWEDPRQTVGVRIIRTLNLSVNSFLDRGLQIKSMALTYYTVLSIVPACALLVAIGRGFGLQNSLQQELYDFFPSQHKAISAALSFVDSYLTEATQGVFVGIGILFLLWTVISLLSYIEDTFNSIWDIRRQRAFYQKITDYIAICLIVPVLMICSSGISIFMSSTIQDNLALPFLTPLVNVILETVPFILCWIAFSLSYFFIPNTKVKFGYACISGFLCAIAFQILQLLFLNGQIYVSKYNAIYGSFAFLPLLLIWLQLSWLLLLSGCVLTYSLQNVFTFNFNGTSEELSLNGWHSVRIYKLNAGAPEPPAPEDEYTLTYEVSTASNQAAPNVSGMPDPQGSADGVFTLSGNVPTSEDSHWTFLGWSENPAVDPARNPNWESEVVKPGATYTATQKVTVLYAIWQFNVSGGGNQGGGGSDVNPPSDPNQGGGGSDTGGGTFN